MLPFEWREMRRYGVSWMLARCLLLRLIQARSFRRAEGVLFLTHYAQDVVTRAVGALRGATRVIPHGVDRSFLMEPKSQVAITEFTDERPCRILYVSIIDVYKHQWNVVEAVAALRSEGLPIVIDLVGPAYGPALRRLQRVMDRLDPQRAWARYKGGVAHGDLPNLYGTADLIVFASSCENMPNILLESMASGVPIACSARGPMPEVLQSAGEYFDPDSPQSIANAIRLLLRSPELRDANARRALEAARRYSWKRCADETLEFVAEVARGPSRQQIARKATLS
jgi:glycosyltransferase involved in cell wall biosynthesis